MKNNEAGFTLIELLMVVTIMGLVIITILPTQSIIDRQKVKINVKEIISDVERHTLEAKSRNLEMKYILSKDILVDVIDKFEVKIIYLDSRQDKNILILDNKRQNKIEIGIDSRGRLFELDELHNKSYMQYLQINIEAGKVKCSGVISGITGVKIQNFTSRR